MSTCDAELCAYWTGDGCICAVLRIGPEPIKSYSHDIQELGYEGDG